MALGNIYYKLEDYEKAEHYLSVAIDRAKFLAPAINCLGIVKIYLGKKNEAVNEFQYGISVDPEYEEFYFNLAKLYSNEKMFSDAIQILDKYLSGNRDSRKGKALLKVIKENAQSINPVEE